MLPKKRRIPRENFSYILSKGLRFNSPKLLLHVSKEQDLELQNNSKIAFSVSKKVCPKAVDRNKYRRRGYSAVATLIDRIKDGYFLFFSFKKGSVPVKQEALLNDIERLLSDAGVIE